MTTTMTPGIWNSDAEEYVSRTQYQAQRTRGRILEVLEQISQGVEFVPKQRGHSPCQTWGQYLYKLLRRYHLGRRPFHCYIKDEELRLELDSRSLRELTNELLGVLDDKTLAHIVACQILSNGY